MDCSRSRVRSSTFCSNAAVGFLQLIRHAIEMVGQFFDFDRSLDVDAMTEIAGLELSGAGLQGKDRHDHLTSQQHTGEHRENNAGRDQPSGPVQQIVDRLERRARKLLGKDMPVQPFDAGRRSQDRPPFRVTPEEHSIGAVAELDRHLRKTGHVHA